ncbi:MAG: NYN domain-containing protein [Sandaracinaceae bacterium]
MAIFCDFENVAIGVRDARYDAFAIEMCLARLLDKGKIVVKKAYADWDRYKSSKRSMHEAAFEMIEIPHVSYSGKNSADIRMVVDALDLCYTKPHIDFFVIISGDSDFSPLVSKLRENDKIVIGMGVKNSSSDLLIENCDAFIYYDDLVRARRASSKKKGKKRRPPRRDSQDRGGDRPERNGERLAADKPAADKPTADKPAADKPAGDRDAGEKNGAEAGDKLLDGVDALSPEEEEERRQEGLDHVLDIIEALFQDRDSHIWGSMVKQVLKRKRPNFSERFHGYRTFSELLEDARDRGLLELSKDERSGGYLITSFGPNA